MNAGVTSERVYEALRAHILDHIYRPGDRLDAASLAEELVSSVTPVRDALHRLTGEGLLETRVSEGFHLPAIDEPGLKDLYAHSSEMLLLALRRWPRTDAPPLPAPRAWDTAIERARAVGEFFLALASVSRNIEHRRATARIQARLNAARVVECDLFSGADDDLELIGRAAAARDGKNLRMGITRYHLRRHRHASEVVRMLYRANGQSSANNRDIFIV